jgi:hypothetical protein
MDLSSGFAKQREIDEKPGATCDEVEAVITVIGNSDRRPEDDG